jgi:hypothetical protein
MKKIVILISVLFSCSLLLNAQIFIDRDGNVHNQSSTEKSAKSEPVKRNSRQVEKKGFDKSKLVFGGDLGLQFGDYTVINISPQVGYNFSKYYTLGAGIGYTYLKDKYYDYNGYKRSYKSSYLGANIFGRLYPIDFIVLSVQPEINYMWRSYDGYKENKAVPSVIVGGGLRLGNMMAMIQYDVVQDKNSPYSDNIFYSIGYTFSF